MKQSNFARYYKPVLVHPDTKQLDLFNHRSGTYLTFRCLGMFIVEDDDGEEHSDGNEGLLEM